MDKTKVQENLINTCGDIINKCGVSFLVFFLCILTVIIILFLCLRYGVNTYSSLINQLGNNSYNNMNNSWNSVNNDLNNSFYNIKTSLNNNQRENFVSEQLMTTPIQTMPSKQQDKITVILVFVEWCPHCVRFKPTWDQIKNKFEHLIEFIEHNCTSKSVPQELQPLVKGYPTLLMQINYGNHEHIDRTKLEEILTAFTQ